MRAVNNVPAPVLEALPDLLKPDWTLLQPPSEYVSRNMLEERIKELSENLKLARSHICARDSMLESQSAQLVFQHMFLDKQNEALNSKQNRKKDDRTMLFDGKAVALTADEFEEKLRAVVQRRADEAAGKERRAVNRATRKDARSAMDAQWDELKAAHTLAIQAWEAECARLTAEGTPKRHLPRKPVRPKKPTLPGAPTMEAGHAELQGNVDDEEGGQGES